MKSKLKTSATLLCFVLAISLLSGCGSIINAVKITEPPSAQPSTESTTECEYTYTESEPSSTEAQTEGTSISEQKVTTQSELTTQIKAVTTTRETEPKTQSATNAVHIKSYFDDAVFVGDSVTLGLKTYVTRQRNNGKACLGRAAFLCAGSMGFTNSQFAVGAKGSIHPKLNGKTVRIDEGIKLLGAKKVFIMLGMNDYCSYPVKTGISNAKKLIAQIREKAPDAEIYIESVTPILQGKEHGKFNNSNVKAFNAELENLCRECNLTFLDIASLLADEDGYLKPSYCGDNQGMGIHMGASGCKVWINYLTEKFGE